MLKNSSKDRVFLLFSYIFLPAYYFHITRARRLFEFFSWMYIYPFFFIFFIFLYSTDYSLLFSFVFYFLSIFHVYESGYIENDIQTVKKEEKPTIRHTRSDQFFINKNYYMIQRLRCVVSILFLVISSFFASTLWVLFYGAVGLILCKVLFFLHNSIRSNLNILTYFMLVSFRYLSCLFFAFIFLNEIKASYLCLTVLVMLLFPVVRTIEHASKPRYKIFFLSFIVRNMDVFRVCYYFCLFLVFLLIFLWFDFGSEFVLMSLYFLVYRVCIYVYVKIIGYRRTKNPSYGE